MNNKTRKILNEMAEKVREMVDEISSQMMDEEEKYDNLSEGLQCSEMGEKLLESYEALDGAVCALEEAVNAIVEATE